MASYPNRNKLCKNVISQYGLQLAKYILPLVTLPYLARVLGNDGYGIRAFVLSVMTFMQCFFDFGFGMSATEDVIRCREDKKAVGKIVGEVYQARVILFVLLGIVLYGMTEFVPLLNQNKVYTVLAFLAVAINAFLPDFVFMGYEQMAILTTRYVVSKLVGTILIFVLIKAPADLLFVPVSDIVTSIIGLTWTIFSMKKNYNISVVFGTFYDSVRCLRKSFLYFISNLSSTAFNSYTTFAIGAFITSPLDISYWSISLSVVNALQSLYPPVFNSLYPHMIANKDVGLIKKIGSIAFPIISILTIALVIMSKPIMCILGGSSYLPGAYIISWLAPLLLISFYSTFFGWPTLGAYGYVKELTKSTLFSGLFNVIVITIFGFAGCLKIATVVAIRLMTEAILLVSRGKYLLKYRKEIFSAKA